MIQTNFATYKAKDIFAIKSKNGIGRIWHNKTQNNDYILKEKNKLSENK